MAEGEPEIIVGRRAAAIAIALLACAAPAVAQERAAPYWASIAAGEAMMRSGPDRAYPVLWAYHRRDLPVRVERVLGAWRRVRERDGSSGWMLASLLAARRTGIVTGGTLRPIRDAASGSGRLLWSAEPGVVGRISRCDGSWCRIQIGDKTGYIEQAGLWGLDPGERIP